MTSHTILRRVRLVCGLSYETVSQDTGISLSELKKIENGLCAVNSNLTFYYAKHMKVSFNLLSGLLKANDGELGAFCQYLSNFYSKYLLFILKARGNDETCL